MHSPKIDKNSQIFNSFCLNSDNQISKKDFISLFKQRGILENDSRLKENVSTLTNSLSKVKQLRGVNFT